MSHQYSGPGEYVAICNNANFDGYYIKQFTIPEELPEGLTSKVEAGWYFLNVVDAVACLEAVYSVEIFAGLAHKIAPPRFKVTIGPHEMPSLELRNPSPEERKFVKAAVCCNHMDDERYILGRKATPFLQCDESDYVLVEFWQPDYKPFVDWLNANYDKWIAQWEEEK